MIELGGNTVCAKTHRPINSIWDEEELLQQWKALMCYQFISMVKKLIVLIIEACHC
jgi:hypothetical protein